MGGVKKYFSEALQELRRVQWPTRNHAVRISVITAIFVASSTLFIGVLDILLSKLVLLSH